MSECQSLDLLVKDRLRQWPQRPPGLELPADGVWMRARPNDDARLVGPFLKVPGSRRLRTLPDGLWLNFGGTVIDPHVRILAIEACSTLTNLLDKRSRYAPSTYSMVAECPVPWLLARFASDERKPRWRATGIIKSTPLFPITFPIRHQIVLYALKREHYLQVSRHHIPHGHEFFVPIDILMAENSHENPAIAALLARASLVSHFLGEPWEQAA